MFQIPVDLLFGSLTTCICIVPEQSRVVKVNCYLSKPDIWRKMGQHASVIASVGQLPTTSPIQGSSCFHCACTWLPTGFRLSLCQVYVGTGERTTCEGVLQLGYLSASYGC